MYALYRYGHAVDTLLFINGQAPAPPTLYFSELLRDEFSSFPLLLSTCQQLSVNFQKRTNSLQRIFILTC